MVSRIHSVTVPVADQDAALDFYVNKLGWEKAMDMPMGPEGRWLTVVPPGAATQIALAPLGWYTPETMPRKDTGISLVSKDIEGDYATMVERGVKFKGPLEVMPWGDKATHFYDIDGNEFFFCADS